MLKEECPTCHGTGAKAGTSPVTCSEVRRKGPGGIYTQQSLFGMVQKCTDLSGLPRHR